MRTRRPLAVLAAILGATFAHAEITVDNFEAGDLVRYPLVMLRGHASGDTIAVGHDWASAHRFPVVHGQYRAVTELTPGVNMLVLQSGRTVLKYRLDYRQPSTAHRVLAVWVQASDEPSSLGVDGTTQPALAEKFGTALMLIQSLYAEAMHDAGYARKTFSLETDLHGKVIVHTVTLPKRGDELRGMDNEKSWEYVYGILAKEFPEATTRWCTLLGFTRYDPVAHRASGHYALGGGSLGAFGSAGMGYWPKSTSDICHVFSDATVVDPDRSLDDSNGRRTVWANAATGLGAIAHEMGHTFGLPHSHDPYSLMSRGFDYFNRVFCAQEPPRAGGLGPTDFKPNEVSRWDAFEAARLNWNPYFQADDMTAPAAAEPSIRIDGDDVAMAAPSGIRVWGADRDDLTPYFVEAKGDQVPKEVHASLRDLRARIAATAGFRITVVDGEGRSVTVDAPPPPP